ncbi:DUF1269 domain-containing protein [Rhizobium leguminosarum]|jgi:uncharacterized membrane protein|uniref:DUF1269 domain-containing protein n=1 Tax=Rhizobium leguminosarum TaxID=384 RepID=UPI0013DD822E|nr:DUF1269 domain-containing protein [Rhizobium leguminosarum]NEK35914.1 DUF1269 domain-containing protein [Rhizobium leguminosarum]
MSDLVVIEFPSEAKAEEARQRLFNMKPEYLANHGHVAIATKQADGSVKLNQLLRPTVTGAAASTRWSDLMGVMFFPLVGAAVDAASEALNRALTDVGINDRFIRDVSTGLDEGNAALFLLIRRNTTDKALEDLKYIGGKVLRTSFDHAKEDALQKALAAANSEAAKTAPTS